MKKKEIRKSKICVYQCVSVCDGAEVIFNNQKKMIII